MIRKILALLFVGSASVATVSAAADEDFNPTKSFESFRKDVLNDYSSFKNGILKNYAKLLEGEWVEYDNQESEDRYASPKPTVAPVFTGATDSDSAAVVAPKTPVFAEPVKTSERMVVEPVELEDTVSLVSFDFFGIPVELPALGIEPKEHLSTPYDYSKSWIALSKSEEAKSLTYELFKKAQQLQLNDYLTYELVEAYVRQNFKNLHSTGQTALAHYLLANMGYGVRVALTDSGDGLLLVPFDRKIYGRPFMNIGGVDYYVFLSDGSYPGTNTRITTCQLPADADPGSPLGLKLSPLNIPVSPKEFSINYGNIKLSGEINENLYPIIYRYPQMDIREYATAVLDPELRRSLIEQLKGQLASKSRLDAVNELLQFTQSAFDYATDDEAHGFEKPYFLEEILFYPQCDCEDRVIFYTYMLWNVLGVENQLLTYPFHESAAVRLDQSIDGNSYDYNGVTFYISDPTYIGSVTGQCMPQFIDEATELEYHYHD